NSILYVTNFDKGNRRGNPQLIAPHKDNRARAKTQDERLVVVTENSVRCENAEVPIIREIMVATTMSSLFVALFALLASSFRTRTALQTEILALRHQLAVFQKNAPRRLRLHRCDRLLWGYVVPTLVRLAAM